MTDWKPYDPAWLVALAKEQHPDPDEAGSEWQEQTDITLEHPTEGGLVLDIMDGNRIGGVEFTAKLSPDE